MKKKVIIFVILILIFIFLSKDTKKTKNAYLKYTPKTKKMKYKYTENFYLSKIDPVERQAFNEKLNEISKELGIKKIDLLSIMYIESGLNPQAQNPITNATGLIQFMPSTAKRLGTTVENLYKMNATQQLKYVKKYLLPFKDKINNVYDLYFAVFFPNAIGKPNDYVLQTQTLPPKIIAKSNKNIDTNKDNKLTKQEVINWINKNIFVS